MMSEISIVSQSNDSCDHCNRKCNNQYENNNKLHFIVLTHHFFRQQQFNSKKQCLVTYIFL